MQKTAHEIYSFDEFQLDITRGALFRGAEEVKLRPKSFEVLKYLTENQGRLVSKDELIGAVWSGTAVTDDSLVQCLKDIRLALGDRDQEFIKTVPRRGYIFEKDVSENGSTSYSEETRGVHLVIEETFDDGDDTPRREVVKRMTTRRRLATPVIVAAALIVFGGGVSYGLFSYFRRSSAPFPSITMKPLTTDGKAKLAAISPDGKYVVYTAEDGPVQTSLWVRQVAAVNPIRISPPADTGYDSLTFSPDGNFIYFVQSAVLYQIPTLGGSAPRKVLEPVTSDVSFSPDGKRMAYVLVADGKGTGSRVMLASADGTGEPQVLASRNPPEVFTVNGCDWSPDGERLVCTGGDNQLFGQMYPVIVDISDGSQTPLNARRWNLVGQKAWLPDGSGFIMDAFANLSPGPQLWHVAYPSGEATPIYSNPNAYSHVSMTADSKTLVALQRQFRVNIFDAEMLPSGIGPPVQLSAVTMGGEVVNTTTADGRILFVSEADGDRDIWIMNSDGNDKRQLTFGPPMDSGANLSPDGRQITYARAGMGIWKMDLDGNNRKQLAEKGMFPDFSADGQWVFYTLPKDKWSLWKVAANGGESLRVTDYPAIQPSFSPDGKYLAFFRFLDPWSAELYILAADTLELVKTLEVLQPRGQFEIDWAPDSSGIIYNATVEGIDKIVLQPFAGGAPQILLSAKSPAETVGGFSMSPDGRRLYFSAGPVDHNVVMFTLER